ncbi:MAG: DUF5686 and carboxypeptidase regulatory-like domain-containing protein [Muribaculaceae bacterium]|nr:DUF5686 and carboxypeptidase regulatory-like domain-containing protein [Muribaculaceae bacterium]
MSVPSKGANNPNVIFGVTVDDFTSEPVSLVTIRTIPGMNGILSNLEGEFSVDIRGVDSLSFAISGYKPATYSIEYILNNRNQIRLLPTSRQLEEVTVKAKRPKYSKKNNPAYELMKKVRNHSKLINPQNKEYYSYKFYNKLSLGLNNIQISKKGKGAFLTQYIDTTVNTGEPFILLSVKERAGKYIKDSNSSKIFVDGESSEGIDKSFNAENIRTMLNDALRDINIFQNDITLMQNRFVSPLSTIADNFYHYYISDTQTNTRGEKRIELAFTPSNYESFGFNGKMWISKKDSICYVDSLVMRIPRATNINYVKNLLVRQSFKLSEFNLLNKETDDLSLEVQLIPGTPSFYGRKLSKFSEFNNLPTDNNLYSLKNQYDITPEGDFMLSKASNQPSDYWSGVRLIPLSEAEQKMGSLLGRLRRFPVFYWGEKILSILVQGYWEPRADFPVAFGPANTLVSYNDIEGLRLRAGGLTTTSLSRHIFARGYVAYGFHDRKWKYNAELEYSFFRKNKIAKEFPVNSIRLSHKYDVDFIGQHYPFTNPDNVFLSLKRSGNYPGVYLRHSILEYKREFQNNFSFSAGVQNKIMYPSRQVDFVNATGKQFGNIKESSAYITLRWAPGERFVQGKTTRIPVNMDAPVFQLSHIYGSKQFPGSDYTLNQTEFYVFKRFWLSAFGYIDANLSGGWIWSKVPYTALLWPNANLSYTIQPESFSLMNPMEFALDKYASFHITYWANGALFNLIPGFKKLKLREVVTFKGVYGGLSSKNNPLMNPDMPQYPKGIAPDTMGHLPYMEGGVGIDNILTILRIDYIWRLTYRNHPGVDKSGLRISLHFSF